MTRFTASERLRRLLAVIPWVAGHDRVRLDEVAARFGYPRDRLEADLQQVVPMVGVYPFTPDTLIEVDIDDEYVGIRYADWFTQPLRLDPDQALALYSAGQTMLAVGGGERGDDPDDDADALLRGLTKLGAAMSEGGEVPLVVRLGDGREEILAALRKAIDDQRVVDIDYYVYGRDEWTQRVIEPHRFFADEGQWYVAAYCRSAADRRVFRVDRIGRATVGDETFEPLEPAEATVTFDPGDAPRVVLSLDPSAAWVADQYPNDGVERGTDGTVEVRLAVTGTPWLERLLLRLGPHVTITEAGDFDDDLVASAATRVLDRYRP